MANEFIVTEELQAKLLAYMLFDSTFCEVSKLHLKPEMFSNKALQWFFIAITEAPIALTSTTLCEEMIMAKKAKIIKDDEAAKYIQLYDVIKQRLPISEEDYLRDKLSTFMKTQAVKRAFEEGFQLAKNQEWDSLVNNMQEAVQVGLELNNLGLDYFEDYEARIKERSSRERVRRIATGIPDLDNLTYGGLKQGQTGLIVGGTGRGKSIFLAWLARMAVLLGKRVVYITCELSEADIADRFDAMMGRVRVNELTDYQEELLSSIGDAQQKYGSALRIKHYPAATATVGTLKAYLKQLSQAGLVPDMVIVDYLDLLKSSKNYGSLHEETNLITTELVGLAAEYNVVCYTATQLNRAGLVMETPDESAMAGYIGKQYHVDLVLWMAQTKEEKEDQLMRLVISKNRLGPAGRTIELDTDYSYMTFYRERIQTEETDEIEANNESSQQ